MLGGKPENPEKNPRSKLRERINNKLNSHVTPSPGIEPEIAVVRRERLAATPPMLPRNIPNHENFSVKILCLRYEGESLVTSFSMNL
jgi:hypothetical protein